MKLFCLIGLHSPIPKVYQKGEIVDSECSRCGKTLNLFFEKRIHKRVKR